MPWPFRSGRPRQAPGAAAADLDPADRAVLEAAQAWWTANSAGLAAQLGDDGDAVLVTRGGLEVVLSVHARRGKLTRVEVHDPTLRPAVDEMVRHFERLGQWSFNGVVRTLEGDGKA